MLSDGFGVLPEGFDVPSEGFGVLLEGFEIVDQDGADSGEWRGVFPVEGGS